MTNKLKHYFATYTDSKETFETSDGFLFHRESDANAHAQTLEKKNVTKHTRTMFNLINAAKDKAGKPGEGGSAEGSEGGSAEGSEGGSTEGSEGGNTEGAEGERTKGSEAAGTKKKTTSGKGKNA